MTVLHLISGLRGGGAEHVVLELCKQSAREGEMKMIVVSLSSADRISSAFRKEGIEVYVLHINGFSSLAAGFRQLQKIISGCKEDGMIIHAHMFHACMFAAALKITQRGTRVVFTLHNTVVPEWWRRVLLFFTRWFRDVDILFPGKRPKWYQRRDAIVIANGIDMTAFIGEREDHASVSEDRQRHTGPEPRTFTCLFAGRLEKQKNPLFLLQLAHAFRDRPGFRIRIAGEGSLEAQLKAAMNTMGLQGRLEFLGYRHDMPELMRSAHCLVLPSLYEGMPLVVLEAGAAGLPVIATQAAGSGAVLSEENAYLGPPEEFPSMIRRLMEYPGEGANKAMALKRCVCQRYTATQMFDAHLQLYRRMQKKG